MAITLSKTPIEGYKYIPASQKEDLDPFVVWVKPISSHALMIFEDSVVSRKDETVYLSAGLFSFRVLQKSLVSWEGIQDANGDALKIKRSSDGTVTEETISYIPSELITEIANVVAAISRNPANIQIFFPEESVEEVIEAPKKVKEPKVTVEVKETKATVEVV